MALQTHSLSKSLKTKRAALEIVEICNYIQQAEKIDDQKHIDFTGFYYENIHEDFIRVSDIHRDLLRVNVNKVMKKSILSDLN